MNRLPIAFFVLGLPIALSAHPGHDLMEHGATHVAASLYHMAILAVISVVSFSLVSVVNRPMAKRLLLGVGALALITLAAL